MTQGIEQTASGNFWGLEDKLTNVLKPVKPDPVFVDALKFKLSRTPAVIMESGKTHIGILAIGAGLFAGVLAYWLYRQLSK